MTENFNPEQAIAWWENAAQSDPIRLITGGHCQNFEHFVGNGFVETRPVLAEIFKHQEKALKNTTVAEYGCGLGRLTFWLHRDCRRAIGVDASPTMIDQAARLMPGPEYLVCDGASFPLKDRSVNVVFSKIVFQHLPRDVVRDVIADAHRVLRPSGLLIFQLPTCEDEADALFAATPQLVSRWTRAEIEDALNPFTIEQLPIGEHWGWHVARK